MTVVPVDQLSPDVVSALIEEFVTRHGAIQGEDAALETKISQVRRLLKAGKAVIVWDDDSETCTILLKEELSKYDPTTPRIVRDDDAF